MGYVYKIWFNKRDILLKCLDGLFMFLFKQWFFVKQIFLSFSSPAGAVGPGTGDIATPPVRLSVFDPV